MFFSISSVRMQSIYKMHGPMESLSEKLTDVQTDDVTSGSMTTPPKVDFGTERVKSTSLEKGA